MKNNEKFARIMALLLTIALLMTFIVPAFAMLASAATVKAEGDAFIVNFTTQDGQMLETGVAKDVKVTVSDQRIDFSADDQSTIGINVTAAQDAFSSGTPAVAIDGIDANGIVYTVTFPGFTYKGGSKDFSFDVTYTSAGEAVAVPLKTLKHTVTQIAAPTPTPAPTATPTPTPTVTPTPTPTPTEAPKDVQIDTSMGVFIQSYKVSDKATGRELTQVNPGTIVKLRFNVIDNRITYTDKAPLIRARMSQGSFKNNDHGDVKYEIMNVGTINGRKILAYQITFDNVTYQGGSQQTSFDVSYTNYNTGAPIAVPYTELAQTITQAVDDVAEPKVILNSANYGGAAYVDRAFTLSTVATNTSAYHDLENVSVRVELPAGVAMASGNSQALIGSVAKNGTINHDFNLIVTGVENDVSSLSLKVVYEYEAYVQGERRTYVSDQSVAINIEQETKFEISKLEHMEAITAGEEDVITVYLLNKGKTSANNVTIEIISEQLNGPQTVFAGNIVPGTESIQDVYFTVNETGVFNGKVVVTYENTKGKQSTLEKDFSMEVMEPYVYEWDEPVYEEPVVMEEPAKFPVAAVVAAAVVALAAAAVIIRKKGKAKQESEDEDEDI